MDEIEVMYNDIIMDHYLLSQNKKDMTESTHSSLGVNPSCGDEITLKLKIKDNIIQDAAFVGKGCAISMSSTSIMIDLIKGKTIKEAFEVIKKFNNMIEKKDETNKESLDEAIVFENISNMPARTKCAKLGYNTLEKILQSLDNKNM